MRSMRVAGGLAVVAALAVSLAMWGTAVPAGATPVCTVTDQVTSTTGGNNVNVSYDGDGSRMAFVSNRDFVGTNADGNNEIFVYDVATVTYTQLTVTSGSGGVNVPSISSSGTRVAFQSSKNLTGGNADGNNEIFLWDATGPTTTQVTTTPSTRTNAAPKISADGSHIVFSSDGDIGGANPDLNQEIFRYTVTGATTTAVSSTSGGTGANASPSVSSTGARVAFRSNRDIGGTNSEGNAEIFLWDATGPTTTAITAMASGASDGPSISADGTRIAFRSTANIGGGNGDANQEIFLYDGAGPTTTQVTVSTGGASIGPSLAADGTRIAFTSNRDLVAGGNTDLTSEVYAFESGAGLTQITSTPVGGGGNRAPSISGDGTGITWESDRDIGGGNADHNYELYRTACGLSVTKTADQAAVTVGGTIDYHVTLQNNGSLTLTGLFVSDEHAPGCSVSLPDLPAGQSATVNCTYSSTLADVGTYTNVAVADSDQTPPMSSNQVDVTVAFPAGTGGIAGTMTEVGSGTPLAGSWVAFLRTSDFGLVDGAVAAGDGTYSAVLPAGSYYLYLIDPANGHAIGFHGPPALVVVPDQAVVTVDPSMTPTRGSITGSVTEQGTADPIADAFVLSIGGPTSSPEAVVTTDGAGGFSLPDLAAGNHWVGYLDPTGQHATEFHPHSPNVPDATPVVVTGGGSAVADGSVPTTTPVAGGAALSGTVVETGTSDPIAGALVVALRASDYHPVRATATDGAGGYLLDVAPGNYFLAFVDRAGRHRMEWHDGQPNTGLESATSVVAPAVTGAALDPILGTMAGTITDDPSGDPVPGAWVIAIGPSGVAGGAVTGADGTYTITGLPVGTYRATFVDPAGGRTQEYFDGSADAAGATPFSVAGGATTPIDADLHHP